MFKASGEQAQIIEEIVHGRRDVVVQAGPGSGKTTTALEAMKHLPQNANIVFVCFNSKIKEENAIKAPKHVKVQTLNGFGWSVCLKALARKGFQRVNEYKTVNAIQKHFGGKWDKEKSCFIFGDEKSEKTYYAVQHPIKQLVSLAKANAIFTADRKALEKIVEEYQINTKIKDDEFYAIACAVYHSVITDLTSLDWDDQIFMPLKYNWPIPTFDYVFVDEAQDLNAVQLMLVQAMAGK